MAITARSAVEVVAGGAVVVGEAAFADAFFVVVVGAAYARYLTFFVSLDNGADVFVFGEFIVVECTTALVVPIFVGESELFDIRGDDGVAVEVDVLGARSGTIDLGHIEEDDGCFARDPHARIGRDAAWIEIGVVFGDAAQSADVVFRESGAFVGFARSGEPFVGLAIHIDIVEEDLPDVVGDDVEDELHIALVKFVGESAQSGQVAEMRIVLEEIYRPISVIRGEASIFFDVFDDGRNPERRDAEGLEVVEFVDNALPIAAVITAHRALIDVEIVVDIAVVEAVDDELVDDFVAPILDVSRERDIGLMRRGGQRIGVDATRHHGARESGDGQRRGDRLSAKERFHHRILCAISKHRPATSLARRPSQ